jgi:hypothetical protein
MRTCSRCQRANPDDAVYCHHDGMMLRGAELPKHPSKIPDRFQREWIFPSGRRCGTRLDLLQGCLAEWESACVAFACGHLGRFLQEASQGQWMPVALPLDASDDVSLQTLLEQLADPEQPPRPIVELIPRRLQIDVRPGETPALLLRISNRGKGYLHGSIQVETGVGWLRLDTPSGPVNCLPIGTRHEQTIGVQILTAHLPKSGNYLGKLILQTNGGTLELPVQANLLSSGGLFQGHSVSTERELAKLLRDRPREAVQWLEKGVVERWFAEQGQKYPVAGPAAPGFAVLQQLFEAMGVARVPDVRLEEREIHIVCQYPEEVTQSIVLTTSDKKWVYAFAECDEFWVKLADDSMAGPQKTEMAFSIDSSLLEPGKTYEAAIHLTANGGQTFTLKITLEVKRPYEPFTRRILRPFFSG